ncbi:hypothetical protein H6G72_05320 [Planktothricoides sp. FACHB-1370]|uniref:Chromophore lyase CpcS/CpeS n=2 Tax=Planktothricoides raciborskii TaxID=132608 RepID=A0ABR8E982_9CYAN|nr:hypothetical protein [Planktothricoides raciborskii FACHB-1370]MBD2581581.1 hypothetical protein [Planktothricoides raciborskii FACHB-1261]
MMKLSYLLLVLVVAVLAGFGLGAFLNQAPLSTAEGQKSQEPEEPTTFKCVQMNSGWATIAEQGNAVSKTPLFTWNSEEFGDNWTPENRCYEVTRRLNVFVGKNGGKLSNLSLTPGQLNGLTVVCVVNQQSACTNDSLLFTLSQKNAATPRTAIAKITDFSQGKANAKEIDEEGYPQYFPLKGLVNFSGSW